jgi:hypothetical protein
VQGCPVGCCCGCSYPGVPYPWCPHSTLYPWPALHPYRYPLYGPSLPLPWSCVLAYQGATWIWLLWITHTHPLSHTHRPFLPHTSCEGARYPALGTFTGACILILQASRAIPKTCNYLTYAHTAWVHGTVLDYAIVVYVGYCTVSMRYVVHIQHAYHAHAVGISLICVQHACGMCAVCRGCLYQMPTMWCVACVLYMNYMCAVCMIDIAKVIYTMFAISFSYQKHIQLIVKTNPMYIRRMSRTLGSNSSAVRATID